MPCTGHKIKISKRRATEILNKDKDKGWALQGRAGQEKDLYVALPYFGIECELRQQLNRGLF